MYSVESMESGEPAPVRDYQVPVLTVIPHQLQPEQWDLTTTEILPHIDGFNHIAKISSLADVGSALVRACVQNLVYHKVTPQTIWTCSGKMITNLRPRP